MCVTLQHALWILLSIRQAVTEMVRRLRKGDGVHGLVLANGGVMTYQHVVCLSSRPHSAGSPYPDRNPLPEVLTSVGVPPVEVQAEGEAIIEVRRFRATQLLDSSSNLTQHVLAPN